MAPAQLAAAWTPKTQAVVVTHLYGIPAPVAALRAALPRPVPIIEDASEALGATNTQGLAVGTLADAGCFSFNGNKLITTGGGGMVVAPQAAWVEALRHYVHQARVPGTTEFIHDDVGINGRMTGLAASLGLAQLARLPAVLAVKRGINRVYSVGLETVAGVARVSEVVFETGESACWLSLVWLETPELREAVLTGLLARGIEARPLFYPLPLLPAFASTGQQASCPVATDLWQRGLCLPSSVSLNASAQDEVMATIQEVMAKTGAAG
jgi:dTDP-4-amino-4,6-dideoxygalactose transaminase